MLWSRILIPIPIVVRETERPRTPTWTPTPLLLPLRRNRRGWSLQTYPDTPVTLVPLRPCINSPNPKFSKSVDMQACFGCELMIPLAQLQTYTRDEMFKAELCNSCWSGDPMTGAKDDEGEEEEEVEECDGCERFFAPSALRCGMGTLPVHQLSRLCMDCR